MQTILTSFAAHSLNRELADRDAHQLRDIGLTRAADGSLRLLNDPSVEAVPALREVRRSSSWRRWLAGLVRFPERLKTAL